MNLQEMQLGAGWLHSMADFTKAYERTTLNEGGYVLTNHAGDRGGQTYAGIARKYHPDWSGWAAIDRGETPETSLVRDFYRENFWEPVKGDQINDQRTAETIYDFGVNANYKVAIKLAQIVGGVASDGDIGPKTLEALNAIDEGAFRIAYALAKIARYRDIVVRDRSQMKFLLGWINRVLNSAS